MATSISVRLYQLTLRLNRKKEYRAFGKGQGQYDLKSFLDDWCRKNSLANTHEDILRSWFLEPRTHQSSNSIHGLIKYGTFGFESRMVDFKSKKENYKRKTTDIEEIPLYYQFWIPDNSVYAYVAIQSFSTRSCISIFLENLRAAVRESGVSENLFVDKYIPTSGARISDASVRTVTMRSAIAPSDAADDYLYGASTEEADYQVVVKAKKKGSLGRLRSFLPAKDAETQAILHNGVEFHDVTAQVELGGKTRTVSIIGMSSNAGIIDLNDSVELGLDGHPKFESITSEVDNILADCIVEHAA